VCVYIYIHTYMYMYMFVQALASVNWHLEKMTGTDFGKTQSLILKTGL